MRRPKVFIGSSSEKIGLAQKIEVWLDEADCDAVLWTGIFEPGDYTAERLIVQARACDGAVLIFSEDDVTWFREQNLTAPRDNVVYELGLFTGAAKDNALKRVIFVKVGDTKVASDLKGITYVAVEKAEAPRPAVREEMFNFAKRLKGLSPLGSNNISPFRVTGKRELFAAGSELISKSAGHVTLAAKTPVPLMGARPYDRTGSPFDYEQRQFDLYWGVAEQAAKGALEFTIVASIPGINEDLAATKSKQFHANVVHNIERLFSLINRNGSKIKLYWHDSLCPPAFLVVDDTALVWWKSGNGDSVWATQKALDLAQALASSRPGLYLSLSYDDVISRISKLMKSHAS